MRIVFLLLAFLSTLPCASFSQSPPNQWPKPTAAIQTMLDEALKIKDSELQIDALKKALDAAKAAQDWEGQAESEKGLARASKPTDRIPWFEAALKDFKAAGNKKEVGAALNNLGVANFDLSRFQKARDYYYRALTISQELGDRNMQFRLLNNIGLVFGKLDKPHEALVYYKNALSIEREAGDRFAIGRTLNNIGLGYLNLDQIQQALDYFNQALPVEREVEDTVMEGRTLNNIGKAYFALGDNRRALPFLTQALSIKRAAGDRLGEATTLSTLGDVYNLLGRQHDALDALNLAIPIATEVGNPEIASRLLVDTGQVYSDLGQYQMALDCFIKALPIAREVDSRYLERESLTGIGNVYYYLNQNQKALLYYSQALDVPHEGVDRQALKPALVGMGNALVALGNYQKALNYYHEALALSEESKSAVNVETTLDDIGLTYEHLGQHQKALRLFNKALAMGRKIGDRSMVADILDGASHSLEAERKPALAILFAKQGVNTYQDLRKDIQKLPRSDQRAFAKKVEPTYRHLADLLIKQGRLREAEKVMTLLKEEENFEFVARDAAVAGGVEGRIETIGKEGQWWDRYQLIQDRALKIDADEFDFTQKTSKLKSIKALSASQKAELARMEVRLKELDSQKDVLDKAVDAYFEEVGKQASTLADSVRVEAEARVKVTGQELPTLLRRLHRDSGESIGAVYALASADELDFLIVTYAGMAHMSVPVKSDDLNTMISGLRKDLMNPASDPRLRSEKLYHLVFEKLIGQLHSAGCNRVVWCLDGTLRYVPLGALWDGNQYLIERDDFTMFDPLNLERVSAQPVDNLLAAGFAATEGKGTMFAPLPGADKELKGVVKDDSQSGFAGAVPGRAYEDKAFDESNLVAAMKGDQFSLLHIATHFNVGNDFNSSNLLLGDGNLLSLKDFTDVGKHGTLGHLDLVCLSACDTAESFGDAVSAGSQFSSFVSLTLKDGASSVVASLWPVSDASTPLLMKRFYENWMAHKSKGKAGALRTAQLSLLRGDSPAATGPNRSAATNASPSSFDNPYVRDPKRPFAHPYYWAPFILFGNWK